jgi:PAS domain S-box-containing protein
MALSVTIALLVIAAMALAILAWYAWRHRTAPGALPLVGMCFAASQWSLCYAFEIGATTLPVKMFWGKLEYFGIAIVPVAWLAFGLHYTRRAHWLSLRHLSFAAVIPTLTQVFVWTTESNRLMWATTQLDITGPFPMMVNTFGVWFWVHTTFSYLCLLVGAGVIIEHTFRQHQIYRWQGLLMLVAIIAPWVSNAIVLAGRSPVPQLDLTPFAFVLSTSAIALDIFRYRFLDIVPVARRVVLDSLSEGVFVIDVRGRIVDLNPAARRILGWPQADSLGRNALQSLAYWPQLQEFVQRPADGRIEMVQTDSLGDVRWFDAQVVSLYERPDQMSGRLVVLRDITDRKHVERELALARDQALEVSRVKGQLLAKVSHELRTPLGSILGYAELLQRGSYGEMTDQPRQAAERIVHSAEHLRQLVNTLLDQAELEADNVQLAGRSFAPEELLAGVTDAWRAQAEAKGLQFTTLLDPELPPRLLGDLTRLQQMLGHLVHNAIQFTASGAVRVSVFRAGRIQWAMQVSDTGSGIPPQAQALVFEPFWQMDKSLLGEKGHGLGLSIVKQLTALMGGQIALESEPGRGSTFTLTLPLYERE